MSALKVIPVDDVVVNPQMTVWIKVGDAEIKREIFSVIHLSEYLKIFDKDWTTLNTRAMELSASRTLDEIPWFEITIWFEGAHASYQDSFETTDPKTGHLFVRLTFEAWKRTTS